MKQKRHGGHACIVCGEVKPNEQFTGKGYQDHVCKACGKWTKEERLEMMHLRTIHGLGNTRKGRRQLRLFMSSKKYSERTRVAAREHLELISMRSEDFEDYIKGQYNLKYIAGYTSGGVPYGSSIEEDDFMDRETDFAKEKDNTCDIDYDEIPF